MVAAFKLLLTFSSLVGIMLFLSRCRLKLKADYLPAAACAILTFILFAASLLSIFGVTVTLLNIFGICYALWFFVLVIRKKTALKSILSPSVVFFILGTLLCVILLKSAVFRAPDVYTHWGRIVKEILSFDGLPTPLSTIGENRGYTPGMALFIAFLLRNVGYSNSLAITCQGIMAVALMSAVFIGASWKKPFSLMARFFLLALCMGGFTSTFNDLMIDYVVCLSGAAMLIVLYEVWNNSELQKTSALIILMPIVTLPVLLKASGIIYSLLGIALIAALYLSQRQKPALRITKKSLPCIAVCFTPLIAYGLWNAYIAHAWSNAEAAGEKFSLNAGDMLSVYSSKPPEMRTDVIISSLKAIIFEPHNFYFFIPLIILIALLLIVKPQSKRTDIVIIVCCAASWLLFNAAYILMMLFLMPVREVSWDSTLAYSRYVGTVTVSLGMFYLWFCAKLLPALFARIGKLRSLAVSLGLSALLCAFIVPVWNNTFWGFTCEDEASKQFLAIEGVGAQVNGMFGRTDRLLVYNGEFLEDSSLYNSNTYECVFLNTNTMQLSNTTLDGGSINSLPGKIDYAVRSNDYLIVASKNDALEKLLLSQGVTMDSPDGIIYKISEDAENGALSLARLK